MTGITMKTVHACILLRVDPSTVRALLRDCGVKTVRGKSILWTSSGLLAVVTYATTLKLTGAGAIASASDRRKLFAYLFGMSPECLKTAFNEGRKYVLVCRGRVHAQLVSAEIIRGLEAAKSAALSAMGIELQAIDLEPLHCQLEEAMRRYTIEGVEGADALTEETQDGGH